MKGAVTRYLYSLIQLTQGLGLCAKPVFIKFSLQRHRIEIKIKDFYRTIQNLILIQFFLFLINNKRFFVLFSRPQVNRPLDQADQQVAWNKGGDQVDQQVAWNKDGDQVDQRVAWNKAIKQQMVISSMIRLFLVIYKGNIKLFKFIIIYTYNNTPSCTWYYWLEESCILNCWYLVG